MISDFQLMLKITLKLRRFELTKENLLGQHRSISDLEYSRIDVIRQL